MDFDGILMDYDGILMDFDGILMDFDGILMGFYFEEYVYTIWLSLVMTDS